MIPEEMRKCVVFIGMHVKDGHQSVLKFGGTGFLVSAPAESDPSIDITYLVTAKHVANAVKGQMFFMRLNTKDGMSSLFAGFPDLTWWFHPSDPTADVAVIPMDTPPVDLDYRVIPTRRFVTTAKIQNQEVGLGDDVLCSGLFAHLPGTARNIPIVRSGIIAMMPEEKISTRYRPDGPVVEMDGYLVESRSIGGLSGSPAFVRGTMNTATTSAGTWGVMGDEWLLLGVVHGYWNLSTQETRMALGPLRAEFGTMNMGITIVVPAAKIIETLESKDAVADRAKRIAAIQEAAQKRDLRPSGIGRR